MNGSMIKLLLCLTVAVVSLVGPTAALKLRPALRMRLAPRPTCRLPTSVKGVDIGVNTEEDLLKVADPEINEAAISGKLTTGAEEYLKFANQSLELLDSTKRPSENLASVSLCKSKWSLRSHSWYISRYYDNRCRCWRYRKAFAPVKVWHRVCSTLPQKCRVVSGCCRQKYTWVGMPVWVRYPVCGGYRYKISWSYIRVGACCECMANVTDNFDCSCRNRRLGDFTASDADAAAYSTQ